MKDFIKKLFKREIPFKTLSSEQKAIYLGTWGKRHAE